MSTSKRPLYFPDKGEIPKKKDRTWYDIPRFPGYQLSLPQLEVRDMRWDKYPEGRLLPLQVAALPKKKKGKLYTRMLADDGVLYKSYVDDLLDLIVKDKNKETMTDKFDRRPNKLSLYFKPVGQNNYKNKSEEVKEYWRDREYAATQQ